MRRLVPRMVVGPRPSFEGTVRSEQPVSRQVARTLSWKRFVRACATRLRPRPRTALVPITLSETGPLLTRVKFWDITIESCREGVSSVRYSRSSSTDSDTKEAV